MTVSVAVSSMAATQSAIAAQQAHQARVDVCNATMPDYIHKGATIEEMQTYAGCVDTIHPAEIGADATIALKILFVVALVGFGYGVWGQRGNDTVDKVMYGVLGFTLAPAALAFVGGILAGLVWLFS